MKLSKKSKTIYLSNTKRRRKKITPKAALAGLIGISIVVGGVFALLPNAYQVSVNGEVIGFVSKKEYIDTALKTVEKQLETKYETEVEIEGLDELKRVHAKKKDLIDPNKLPSYLRENMDVTLKFQKLIIDGEEIAIIESPDTLEELKDELKEAYFDDKDVNAKFTNEVKLEEVYTTEDKLVDMDTLVDLCKKRHRKEVTYTVAQGDSLWSIATKFNITVDELLATNKEASTNLKIGQELKATVRVPVLGMELIKEEPTSKEEGKTEKTP